MLRVAIGQQADLPGFVDTEAVAWMCDEERKRWAEQPEGTRRREFAASRWLLRGLLRNATGVAAEAWHVSARSGAAPEARPLIGAISGGELRASLSHRLGWVAAAVSDAAVGVDVECAGPARSDPHERAALMLAPEELPAWNALGPAERESALLVRWTAKEAWFKAVPRQDTAWDFRRVVARACAPARANVRVWVAAPLHVAVCCDHPRELAEVECDGLDPACCTSTFWHVAQA